jgi:hypothetical protein
MYRDLSRFLILFVEIVVGFVEVFILFRIILKLFGANPNTPFVTWVYETTRGLVAPFAGIFPSPVIEGGFVIEFSSIFALVIYALIGYFLTELIMYIGYSSSSRYSVRSQRTTVTS